MIFCFFNFFLRNTYSQLAEHLSSAEQSSRKAAVDSLVFTHAVGSTISTTTKKSSIFYFGDLRQHSDYPKYPLEQQPLTVQGCCCE